MSTIVFQGLHSYFESQLIETTMLKLKVANCMVGYETNKEKCHIQETNYKPPNLEYTGWNSIQNLSNVSFNDKETTQKPNSSYIHPLTKKSPRLSQKSLELCTENLGSETGSDDSIDISIMSLNSYNNSINPKSPLNHHVDHQNLPKQMKPNSEARSFPPPLTTMRSPKSIQFMPYREDGRLRIEAFEVPARNTYLHAERSDGRLILSFVNDSANNLDDTDMTNEDNAALDTNELELNHENNDQEDLGNYVENERNMDEINTENIQKAGRCKENQHGNKSSSFWRKPMCVATS